MIDFNLLKEYLIVYFTNVLKYIKENNRNIFFIAIFVIILLSIAIYISFNIKNKTSLDRLLAVNELADSYDDKYQDKSIIIYLFYTDWCPICNVAMPEWNKFTQEIEKQYNELINVEEIDCDSEDVKDQRLVKKYNINAYPTVKLIYKGNIYDYDYKIEKNKLLTFVNEAVENS